jgi:hypothetical protein
MSTLLDIVGQMEALDTLLEELQGDVSDPKVESIICEWFAENKGAFDDKVDGYCALVRQMELRAAARQAEVDRLAMRVRVDENGAKRLKDRLKLVFELRGEKKVQTRRYMVSIVQNGGKAPVEIAPDAQIPEDCQRVIPETREADKGKLLEALEAGRVIPGVVLGSRGTRLSIR